MVNFKTPRGNTISRKYDWNKREERERTKDQKDVERFVITKC